MRIINLAVLGLIVCLLSEQLQARRRNRCVKNTKRKRKCPVGEVCCVGKLDHCVRKVKVKVGANRLDQLELCTNKRQRKCTCQTGCKFHEPSKQVDYLVRPYEVKQIGCNRFGCRPLYSRDDTSEMRSLESYPYPKSYGSSYGCSIFQLYRGRR